MFRNKFIDIYRKKKILHSLDAFHTQKESKYYKSYTTYKILIIKTFSEHFVVVIRF